MSSVPYRIEISSGAEREIGKLPKSTRERIYAKLAELARQPRPDGVKKLKGTERDYYRIRVSDYRIIYEIAEGELLLLVVRVRHRREAYRDL